MANDNFFIRPDYVTNSAVTFDSAQELYWDEQRAKNAESYQKAVYDWANELIRSRGFKKVADLGCGTAVKLAKLHEELPQIDFYGFDQPNAIQLCKKHHQFGTWTSVNFDNPELIVKDEFDMVISSDVIEHLEDPDCLLECIRRLSGPDTIILLSTPEREIIRGPDVAHSPIKHHVREWSRSEFEGYIRSRGFEITESRLLPGFNCFASLSFFKRALRRWLQLKSIRYSQVLLVQTSLGASNGQ